MPEEIEIIVEEATAVQVIEIHVDVNSAQAAIDAAQAAIAAAILTQAILDQISAIFESIGVNVGNRLLQIGEIERSGNNIIFKSGWVWQISGNNYTNLEDITIPVPLATNGFYRTDIFVCDDSDNIYRVAGTENATISIQPATPINTIFLCSIIIYGDTVYNPTDPLLIGQNNFVRKLEIPQNYLSGTGTLEEQICEYILALQPAQRTILETDSKWNVVIVDAILPPPFRIFNNKFNNKFA